MASTEEQLKQVLAGSNGKVHKSVLARTLRISTGYLDIIGNSLKRKGEITISGGWYTLNSVAACKDGASVIKDRKVIIAAMSSLVFFGALFGGTAAVRSSAKGHLQIPVTVPITGQYKLPRTEEREKVIEKPKQVVKMNVAVTFYSSTPDQTDNTPFLTANGTVARDGIAASNFLAFGTRIKLPELFPDKQFVIEDRMHSRFTDRVDVWVPTREEALNQGISFTTVEIY